jgi:hypothetical protein
MINISLGEQHVGYKRLDFPKIKLSVVGGRPFSCGGDRLFRPKLLSKWFVRHILTDIYILLLTFLFCTLVFLCHLIGFREAKKELTDLHVCIKHPVELVQFS